MNDQYLVVATHPEGGWTATIGDYDGSGEDMPGALLALIDTLYESNQNLAAKVLAATEEEP